MDLTDADQIAHGERRLPAGPDSPVDRLRAADDGDESASDGSLRVDTGPGEEPGRDAADAAGADGEDSLHC